MRASVPSLVEAREDFVNAMGLQVVEDFQLHSDEDEALWGLAGAEANSLVLRADNFLLELVEYRAPEPRPRPEGYLLSDAIRFCWLDDGDHGFRPRKASGTSERENFDSALSAIANFVTCITE